jgi:hypothetical protein
MVKNKEERLLQRVLDQNFASVSASVFSIFTENGLNNISPTLCTSVHLCMDTGHSHLGSW